MKLFKKFIALFLVSIIAFNECAPLVKALENLNEQQTKNITNLEEESSSDGLANGTLEIETHLALPIRNTKDCDINLELYLGDTLLASTNINEENGYYVDKSGIDRKDIRVTSYKMDNDGNLLQGYDSTQNIVYYAVNIYNLAKGTYKIKLSGKHFVDFETSVTLDDYSKRVSITNEKGMFAIGDINNDKVIDNKDINEMLKAIQENDITKDLNLDGIVDIADLNYITANIVNEAMGVKIQNTNIILSNENVTLNTNANVVGDINSIFTNDGVVTLEATESDEVKLDLDFAKNNETVEMEEIRINFGSTNVPDDGYVVVETADKVLDPIPIFSNNEMNDIHLFTEDVLEGTRVIDLGGQVAVKKVTIVVVPGKSRLADIAKVEFLNNVKVEPKEPENFYTPKYVEINDKVSEQITVSFESVPNVTGYEIEINGDKMQHVIFQTTYTTFTIEDLKNYVNYEIKVRAVNQEWRSGWSDVYIATPQATRVPPAVDDVFAEPTYAGIDFRWKKMDDTKTYNLYYREVGVDEWTVIREINGNTYSLRNLKASTKYEAYLTGNNDLGEGSESQHMYATTLEQTATIYPKYKLINTYNNATHRTDHIMDVIYTDGLSYRKDQDNNVTDADKWSMADDDYQTYWEKKDWQVNAHSYNGNAPVFVLDNTYKMDEFIVTVPDGYPYSYKYANTNDDVIRYWNTSDTRTSANMTTVQAKIIAKEDKNKRKYYVLKLDEPIEANALQFGLTVTGNGGLIQVAEFKLYEYDSLVDDVAALFLDDLRVELANDVTEEKIQSLRERANIKDNDEYNPYRESILNDLDYAEQLLKDTAKNDVITLNPNISNQYNNHLGFAMTISDYQPLGVSVHEGEQITIYVGNKGNAKIEAVFTQTYAQPSAWSKSVALQNGQNVITVPKIGNATDERGGSVYIRYTTKPDVNNLIKVRVSGGVKIPVLDTTLLTTESAKKDAIKNYINELSEFVSNLPAIYTKAYEGVETSYSYNAKTSALGVTEIVTKYGLWSFSSEAVLNAINTDLTTEEEKINRLYESTEAFDEMMLMFYRHKGLAENAAESINELPKARINIRYMRMFDGAFMYAGGYHVGIEYGSIAGVIQGKKASAASGYFGWGISHEVGHQINQGNLVHAEVTNNVYALLAQTVNDTETSRLEGSGIYDKIYDKVTSHTLGKAQNVFVTLGMYWQLHLAYDDNKTFTDTDSIFARINKYSRDYKVNNKNVNNYKSDDLLILFASMAAGKDLTDYFAVWGIEASETLKNEIVSLNLPKEERAIYYLNDEARRYKLNGGEGILDTTKVVAKIKDTNTLDKRITIELGVTGENNKILGYEIIRNGESIAFVTGDKTEFTDNIGSMNNRAFTYKVVAYDKLLNKTAEVILPEVKIEHDGSVKKDNFTVESNFKGTDEIVDYEDDKLDYKNLSVNNLIDGDLNKGFNGVERIKNLVSNNGNLNMATDNENAYIIINLNTRMSLSGIKYTALVDEDGSLNANTIKKYKISVSSDKVNWTEARVGEFVLNDDNSATVYFMKQGTDSQSQIWTYHDVSYVKIEADGNKTGISGAEIDIIAPPGDNINFTMLDDNSASIGKLAEDYCYLTDGCENKPDGIIKAGSVIIEGTYAGSPALNVLKIADAFDEEKYYGGYQLIFAEVNSDLTVYEVSKGTWLYVMDETEYERMVAESANIRANLYRVTDANTHEGERLTSNSKAVSGLKHYSELGNVTLKNKM